MQLRFPDHDVAILWHAQCRGASGWIECTVNECIISAELGAAVLAVALFKLEAFSWKTFTLPLTLPCSSTKTSTTCKAARAPGSPPTPLTCSWNSVYIYSMHVQHVQLITVVSTAMK